MSIQQPVGSSPLSNPFPALVQEAEERAKVEELAARMDEESGRTTGAGRPPASPPIQNIIFGSRLAGPAPRAGPDPQSVRIVEGVRVPPRPEEPDNCCMSYVSLGIPD